NTLKYMVRSGRVSKVTGFAGSLVNLKPVITNDPNGKGGIATMAFSEKSNTEKILQMMTKDHKERKIIRFSIGHANDEVRALEFSKLCQNLLGFEPEYMMNISTIVGMSAGTGAVAVAYMTERG
ncbi:MAG: fatty acid-binding protein DegV, partial [Clostridium sp.]|nr:fatty acid-binding protein DegV [Clostridium sp.]